MLFYISFTERSAANQSGLCVADDLATETAHARVNPVIWDVTETESHPSFGHLTTHELGHVMIHDVSQSTADGTLHPISRH